MCGCSYLDAQVGGEAEAHTYYRTRATTVPSEWMFDDDAAENVPPSTEARDPLPEPRKRILPPELRDARSFETYTTVTMKTNSFDSDQTPEVSNASICYRHGKFGREPSFEADFSVDSRFNLVLSPHDFQVNKWQRRHNEKIPTSKERLSGYSRCVLREVQQEGAAVLPYLHATGGYEC
jgi:hypothetical protein